jgi:hypothetical protein
MLSISHLQIDSLKRGLEQAVKRGERVHIPPEEIDANQEVRFLYTDKLEQMRSGDLKGLSHAAAQRCS